MISFPFRFFISWILYLLGLFGVGPVSLYVSGDVSCQPPCSSGYWGKYISISNLWKIFAKAMSCICAWLDACLIMLLLHVCIAACCYYTCSRASVHIHQLWLRQATTGIPQNEWEMFDLGKSSIKGPKH